MPAKKKAVAAPKAAPRKTAVEPARKTVAKPAKSVALGPGESGLFLSLVVSGVEPHEAFVIGRDFGKEWTGNFTLENCQDVVDLLQKVRDEVAAKPSGWWLARRQ